MATIKPPRIQSIDALRGIALAGIVICHMVENFIGAPAPEDFNTAVHQGTADSIVDVLIFVLLRGKFIALFSFLFGLSFFIQMDNGAQKASNSGRRFLWRLFILLLIGYAHSLFYRGDILTIYAFLGIFLIPFFRMNNTVVLGCAMLLFLGLGRIIVFSIIGGDSIWGRPLNFNSDAPWLLEYYETIKNGTLLDVFKANFIDGHRDKWDFQFSFFGRGYFTFGFFLIGIYAGRTGLFTKFREEIIHTKNLLLWSTVVFVLSIGLTAAIFASLGENVTFDSWMAMAGLTAMDIANTAMTGIWIAVFITVYRVVRMEKWLLNFAPYGRMALSNYVLQSSIGTGLLYGWGFGLIGELRQLHTFGLALLLIVIQVWYSKIWLRYFMYGPLEWLWRSLTFFKSFPIRKR